MAFLKEHICETTHLRKLAFGLAFAPICRTHDGCSAACCYRGPLRRVASAFVVGTIVIVLAARPQLSLAQSPPDQSRTKNRDSDVRRWAQSAETLLQNGEYAKAAVQYQKILRLDPSYHEAHFFLGACYSQTGDFVKAEKSLRTYLALEPHSADGHTTLGLVLARTGRTSEARR